MSVSSRSSDTEEQAETDNREDQDEKNNNNDPHDGVSLLARDKDTNHSLSITNFITGNDSVSRLILEFSRSSRDGTIGSIERNASRESGRTNFTSGSLNQVFALVALHAGSNRNHGLVNEQFEISRSIA